MKRRTSSQTLTRKAPLPPHRVILDAKTKARRKRVKAVPVEPTQLSSQSNAL